MGKVFFFERRKSRKKSDVAEVKEEKPEELFVEAGEKASEPDLKEADVLEDLGQLRSELKEFEKLRGGIRATISSIEKLVPRLKESKDRLVKDTDEKQKGVEHLTQKIPKLKKHKEELLQSIEQTQEQKRLLEEAIEERQREVEQLTKEIPKLKQQEKKLTQGIQQNQKNLTQINDQIKEIESIQKYGIDFVSALVYASQKSRQ